MQKQKYLLQYIEKKKGRKKRRKEKKKWKGKENYFLVVKEEILGYLYSPKNSDHREL